MSYRDEQRIRREQARRRRSRLRAERFAAVGSLVVVALIVGVIVLTSGTGSGSRPSKATAAGSARSPSRGRSVTKAGATRPGTAPVPILVYHVINTQPANSAAAPALYVPVDEFSSQMQALKANGWHAVTLNQVEAYWTRGVPLGPGEPIVITFDSGYASQYTNALPVLKGLRWVGVENLLLNGLPAAAGGISDAQIRGLIAAGWEIDSQGISQTDLTAVDPVQLSADVAMGRQMLRSRYGVPVNWFSYPLGDYNSTVSAAVRAAGYLGATTVNPGWARPQQDRFRLPRLVVVAGTSPAQLLAQITAAKATAVVPASHSGPGFG